MDKWKIIIEWANLPLQKQIVTALAAFIISNLTIVFFFLNREAVKEVEYKTALKEKDLKIEQVQQGNSDCWKYHTDYVDKKENEYQNILIELKKMRKP